MLGILLVASTVAVSASVEWPGLRGPRHDGSAGAAQLFEGDNVGLSVGWSREIGSGYSAIAVGDGRAITMHAGGENDVMSAFDIKSGNELWRYEVGKAYVGHDGSHDGPISTPLLSGNRVFGLGPRGKLFALDATDGNEIWSVDLAETYKAKKPHYGFSTSPLIADGVLVVEIGIDEGHAIAGFDPADGKQLWTLGDDTVQYQSPVLMHVGERMQVVAMGAKKVFGIDAAKGTILWEYEHAGSGGGTGAASSIPVPAGDGRFLIKKSPDASAMLQVTENDGVYEVSEMWDNNSFRGTYVTPVYYEGHLYGISGRVFTCVDAASGETVWRSREPGDGFPTRVGEHLVIITKPGSLHVIDATPDGYNEIAQLDLFDEHSWSEVAFADGHLFARSMNRIARVDLGAPKEKAVAASWVGKTRFGAFLSGLESAGDKTAAIDEYLAGRELPIVEAPNVVHFVYRGEANDVGIVGDLIGFRREDPMVHVPGTDLFYYSTRVEPNAAGTYGFIVDYGDEPVADPANERKAEGLFGEVSFFSMPGWDGFAYEGEAEAPGRIETLEWESAAFEGAVRKADVWLPADYDASSEYPVLYVLDAKAALEQGSMKATLDHVVGRDVEPLLAVFVYVDEENRREATQPPFATMLLEELIPTVDEKYSTIASAGGRALAGSGGAANVVLGMAFNHPDTFGGVGAQSPNLGFFGPTPLDELAKGPDEAPMNLYIDWGTYHLRSPHEAWDMAVSTREGWAMLREKGYRPAGGERPEGFGWAVWRAHTDDMLTALFPKAN